MKRGRTKVSVGHTVVLRNTVDLSDRWVPCTDRRKQDFVPAGVRGKVVQIDDGRPEGLDVRVEFPVLGITDWFRRGTLKVISTEDY